jgi:rubrerythrin
MKWRCTVCNYVHDGDSPPDFCPNCGAPKDKFVKLEGN